MTNAAKWTSDGGEALKAPFVWFGGKRRVADEVWAELGEVDNYIEPFAGSLAVLLARPDDRWQTGAETVNDADSYLSNFWRALAAAPDEVAHWADWPVNEMDLFARHLWLVNSGKERIAKMEADPDFYDAKVAGWWVWGINAWIGSGWCSGSGPWQLPHLGDAGQGVNRKRPHLGGAGRGVNRQRPGGVYDYFEALATRLRRVRVCCGDWARVVTDGAMSHGNSVGVFLDPPYQGDMRRKDLYRVDDHTISKAVRVWAVEHGDDQRLRIVLAGYEDEHEAQMPASWRRFAWSGNKSYGTTAAVGSKTGNDVNRHNERLWFSPYCLTAESGGLFAEEKK